MTGPDLLAEHRARQAEAAAVAAARRPPVTSSYVVGLPVILTVHPDGSVTYEVDLSEASDLDEPMPGEDQDEARVEDDAALIAHAVNLGTIKAGA